MADDTWGPTPAGGEWGPALDDLGARRDAARRMGGEARLAAHNTPGRLDARGRVDALVDPGSFREFGTLAGDVAADAIVAGWGTIDGRAVMVGAEDFTTVAGTIGPASNAKRHRLAELALTHRCPLVMLLEGAGHRAVERPLGKAPTDLVIQAQCSGRIPLVVGVLGPSAGHGALVATLADFTVMTADASIFTAGPPVVREATGQDVDKAALGGPGIAVPAGVIHNVAPDDRALLAQLRSYLGYFPSSAWGHPPSALHDAPGPGDDARCIRLLDIVPRNQRRTYDMREVLAVVFDETAFEVQPAYGPSVICALARLHGHPVAVVANQPSVLAGAVDAAGAAKAAHFITVADSFHLPLIFLADNPGMRPGPASERAGVLRAGGRMFAAQTLATTTKIHLTLRKAYGFGSMVMAMCPYDGQSASYAYPGATLGAMGAGAHARAAGADATAAAALRDAEQQAAYRSAERFSFDELIDPRHTRRILADALSLAVAGRDPAPRPVARIGITP